VKAVSSNFSDLLAAIQAELIQPLSELDEKLVSSRVCLRLRTASCLRLTDESQKQVVHSAKLSILEKRYQNSHQEWLFEIRSS